MNYVDTFRCKGLVDGAENLVDMAIRLEYAAKELREMAKAGIELEVPVEDDYAFIMTTDLATARKYGLTEEDELIDDSEEDYVEEDDEEDVGDLLEEDEY